MIDQVKIETQLREELVLLQAENKQLRNRLEKLQYYHQDQLTWQENQQQLEALYQISRGISMARNEYELLRVFVQPAVSTGLTRAELNYIDLDKKGRPEWLEPMANWFKKSGISSTVGIRSYLPDLQFAKLWIDNPYDILVIPDINTDERLNDFVRQELLKFKIKTWIIIPLLQSNRWVGTISLGWAEQRNHTEKELTLYRAITSLAATAVENHRLFIQQEQIASELQQNRDLLEKHQAHLEALVADRTYRLELITALSGYLIANSDLHELLDLMVNQVKNGFGYYHVHVYLLETETEELVMFAGSGKVGKELKAREHRLKVGQGIVGMVAQTNTSFISNNVDKESNFFRNLLLPDTRSELAVPLRKWGKVRGVLDIQDRNLNRFLAEDVTLMQSIADQTAIAIDNARLLAEQQATIAKLRQVDRTKSEFITMISHELRTPLNAINGFAELLMMGLSGDLPKEAQEDIELIYNSGQHLLALINDIIDISQIEAGKVKISCQNIYIQEFIADVLLSSNQLIKNKPIEFVTNVVDDMPLVYADPTRLKQILLNLLSNATKFTRSGFITISVGLDESLNNYALISVQDTGIGIPSDKCQAIFDQFSQVDMSDSREFGGLGLGLTICQKLVRLHRGEIGVQSEEGVGSEFYFTMPLAE